MLVVEQVAAPRLAGGPTSSTDPPRRTGQAVYSRLGVYTAR